jgi:hypothetical protein
VFVSPFTLGKDPEVYPAGAYDVETKAELVERGGYTAHVRTGTMLIISTATGTRSRPVKGSELEEALARDAETEPSENPDRARAAESGMPNEERRQ